MTTMTEIQCFNHTLHNRDISVSAVMVNGELWFRAKDVALALGYANHTQAIRHNVDEQDRKRLKDFKKLKFSWLPECDKGDVETHSDSEQTTSGELGSLKFRPPSTTQRGRPSLHFRNWPVFANHAAPKD